jgi:hypothetical protein
VETTMRVRNCFKCTKKMESEMRKGNRDLTSQIDGDSPHIRNQSESSRLGLSHCVRWILKGCCQLKSKVSE